MNTIIRVKYLLIYLILNSFGFVLAFKFWWSEDPLVSNSFTKTTAVLLFSAGICWIGILFISTMLSRILILKTDNLNFVTPLELIDHEYFGSEIGIENANKIKNRISLIAFPTMLLTIASFLYLINNYENNQLKKYGRIEIVTIKEIHLDKKENRFVYFEYENKKYAINLNNDTLKVNDNTKIIYSKMNPHIVRFYKDFKNNL